MHDDGEPLSLPPEADASLDDAPPNMWKRAKARVAGIAAGLETIRPQSRTVSAGFLIYERDRQFPTSLLVGAIAARLVIFLIPFLVLTLVTIGVGSDFTNTDPAEVAAEASLPELFAQAAADTTTARTGLRGFALAATVLAVLWAANGLGKTLQLAFAVVWRVPKRPSRRWYLPLVVIAVVLALLSINALGSQFQEPGPTDDAIRLGVELILVAAIWLLASRGLPHAPGARRWRDFFPGSALAALAVLALHAATLFYLAPKWSSLNQRYGTIAIILVMLSWAYIVAAAAVYSAHVNAALHETSPGKAAQRRPRVLPGFIREQWREFRGEPGQPR